MKRAANSDDIVFNTKIAFEDDNNNNIHKKLRLINNVNGVLSVVFKKLPNVVSEKIFEFLGNYMIVPLMFLRKDISEYLQSNVEKNQIKILISKFNKNFAVPNGYIGSIEWTIDYLGYEISKDDKDGCLCSCAARENQFKTLKWLHLNKMCKLSNKNLVESIDRDNPEMFRWLVKVGINPSFSNVYHSAAKSLDILKLFFEPPPIMSRCRCQLEKIEKYNDDTNNDNDSNFKLIDESNKNECSLILESASMNNNFKIVNYLINERKFKPNIKILSNVLITGNYNMFLALIAYYSENNDIDNICNGENYYNVILFLLGLSGRKDILRYIFSLKDIKIIKTDMKHLIYGACGSENYEFFRWVVGKFRPVNIRPKGIANGIYYSKGDNENETLEIIKWIFNLDYFKYYYDTNNYSKMLCTIHKCDSDDNNDDDNNDDDDYLYGNGTYIILKTCIQKYYNKIFNFLAFKEKNKNPGTFKEQSIYKQFYQDMIITAVSSGNIEVLDMLFDSDNFIMDHTLYAFAASYKKLNSLKWLFEKKKKEETFAIHIIVNSFISNLEGTVKEIEILNWIYDTFKDIFNEFIVYFNDLSDNEVKLWSNFISDKNLSVFKWFESKGLIFDLSKIWKFALQTGQYLIIKWIYKYHANFILSIWNEDSLKIAISTGNSKLINFFYKQNLLYKSFESVEIINKIICNENLPLLR
jgi:hypothetical protein